MVHSSPSQDSASRKAAPWLLLMVALAAALRLYNLGEWSLWIDESFTIIDALGHHGGDKPVNYALVRFFLMNFGIDEWTARIGPALAGILAVIVVFQFAKRLFDGPTGLVAALFLALSSWSIYWSQNSRHYSLLLLLALLCLYFFYTGFEEDRPWKVLVSLFFFGIGAKTHQSIAFLMPALVSYLALLFLLRMDRGVGYRRRSLLVFFIPILIGGAVFVPKYAALFIEFAGFTSEADGPIHVLQTTVYYVQVPFAVLSGIMAVRLVRQRDRRGFFLGLSCVVPLTCLLLASLFSAASSLYIYYTLPIYIVLTAGFLTQHLRNSETRNLSLGGWGLLAVLILTQLSHVYFYFSFQHGDRPRWKEAASFLISHVAEDDVILSTAPPVLEYYFMKEGKGPAGKIDLQSPSTVDWPRAFSRTPGKVAWLSQTALEKSKNRQAVWLVTNVSIPTLWKLDSVTREWVGDSFRSVRNYPAWTGGKNRTVQIYYRGPDTADRP
jgi:mannosyltransferase